MEHHSHGKKVFEDLMPISREFVPKISAVYKGYQEFEKAVLAPGTLDTKTKHLIGLAIAVVERCEGCIASHAMSAAKNGASQEEAAEAISVSILMSGSSGWVHGARAYAAFCEFADSKA